MTTHLPTRLRILHVVFSLDPGGMENGVVNVAGRLDPEVFEVHVSCLERSGAFAERLPEPANVHALGKARPGFSWKTVGDLGRVIGRVRPHLLHSHNFGPLVYSSLATWGGWRTPILQGEHGQLTGEFATPRRLRQRRLLYRCCRKVHTVSEGLRDHLISHGLPKDKMVAVVNGVDLDRFHPRQKEAVRRELGWPEDGIWLGMVGRLCRNKRHAVLFEAFERLAERHPRLRLVIVGGTGPDEREILEQVRVHPYSPRILLAGQQNDPVPWYQAMDLLVVPSVVEGLTNVVLEAMACGVSALGHEVCGNAEVIHSGEDGVVADLKTSAGLQAELENLLQTPQKILAMGAAARRKMENRFSLDRMTDDYARLYKSVVES